MTLEVLPPAGELKPRRYFRPMAGLRHAFALVRIHREGLPHVGQGELSHSSPGGRVTGGMRHCFGGIIGFAHGLNLDFGTSTSKYWHPLILRNRRWQEIMLLLDCFAACPRDRRPGGLGFSLS
jgi:hypothetical protein